MADRPRIVLAHGRAAQFDIPDSTSRLWADALRLSLLRVGSKYADQVDVDYAYFGGFWRTDTKHASPRFRDSKGRRYRVELEPAPRIVVEPAPPGGAGGTTPFPPNLALWLNLWSDSDAATGVHGDPMSAMFPSTPPGRAIQHGQNWGRTAEATNPFVAHDPLDYLSSLAMGVALHAALEEAH